MDKLLIMAKIDSIYRGLKSSCDTLNKNINDSLDKLIQLSSSFVETNEKKAIEDKIKLDLEVVKKDLDGIQFKYSTK